MDYLNVIGIAIFALFGLWAFQKGAEARKERRRPGERPEDDKEFHEER